MQPVWVRIFVGMVVCVAMGIPASGESGKLQPTPTSWPTYRGGSQFRGVAPGTLADDYELTWTFKTGGSVKSSPVISRNLVFIGSNDQCLYAIDLQSGVKRWEVKTHGAIEAPPIVVDNHVYVGSFDGQLYAIEAATGTVAWKYPTEDKIIGSANWTPLEGHEAGGILVGSYDNHLYCIDAATGELYWRVPTENYVNGGAAVDRDHAYFGACDGGIYVVSISKGVQLARVELNAPIAGTIALEGQSGYIGHYGNQFIKVDLRAQDIKWKFEDLDFPFFSSPGFWEAGSALVFGSAARRIYCVNQENGRLIWKFNTRGKVEGSPVVCGDRVIVGSADGWIYLLSMVDGSVIWTYQIGAKLVSSPAVANGMIVIGGEDGVVYAFQPIQDISGNARLEATNGR